MLNSVLERVMGRGSNSPAVRLPAGSHGGRHAVRRMIGALSVAFVMPLGTPPVPMLGAQQAPPRDTHAASGAQC